MAAVDECVQLHGGYGYMLEYPIAKALLCARAYLRRLERDHEGDRRAHSSVNSGEKRMKPK